MAYSGSREEWVGTSKENLGTSSRLKNTSDLFETRKQLSKEEQRMDESWVDKQVFNHNEARF